MFANERTHTQDKGTCKPTSRLNGAVSTFSLLTAQGSLGLRTEDGAASALRPTICKCCPRPPRAQPVNPPTPPDPCCSAAEWGWKGYREKERKITTTKKKKRKMSTAGIGCGAKEQKTI